MSELPADMKTYNRDLIEKFRVDGGPEPGRPLLLLTTIGARTGSKHTAPMMYVPDGDRLLVIASNAGSPKNPDWYYNLLANPEVTVELGAQTFAARAVVATGGEHERLWARICGQYPFFTEHQAQVKRTIPVVALERIDER